MRYTLFADVDAERRTLLRTNDKKKLHAKVREAIEIPGVTFVFWCDSTDRTTKVEFKIP